VPNLIQSQTSAGVNDPNGNGIQSDTRSQLHRKVWWWPPRRSRVTFVPLPARARVTQFGVETLAHVIPTARTTQFGIETLVLSNPSARITQFGVETLVQLGSTFAFYPPAAKCGAITKGPTYQIKGGAIVIAGQAAMGAITKPGPKWSVTVFGELATMGAITPPVPDPSFDIRPAKRIIGAVTRKPWLGAPFNANDFWANATVINPASVPYDIRGSTVGFTLEAGEPQPKSGSVSATGWFEVTPTTSGYYQFSLLQSAFLASIAVYQQGGSGITGLTEVGSAAPVGGSPANLDVYLNAGTTYWIQVGTPGSSGVGGIFELQYVFASATCAPADCGGTISANFWEGWNGSGSPSVVGGFGGFPEVARARCPANWSSMNFQATLVNSTNRTDQWFLCWEIHDKNDQLLGGRGNFFTGPLNGINSWQDKELCGVGQTVNTTVGYSPSLGGDTTQAYWFVFYAFPPTGTVLTAQVFARATFNGVCALPGLKGRVWAWWI
jgi:hypothetical protein